MRTLNNRTKRVAIAVSLAAGLSAGHVGAVIAPSPAIAASAAAAAKPKLADALLGTKDLPKGYAAFDIDAAGAMLPGVLDPNTLIGSDPCAGMSKLPDLVVPPQTQKPQKPPKPQNPVKPSSDPAVKGQPPVERAADKPKPAIKLEVASFMKEADGPMLLETLAGTGRELAGEMVDDTRAMLKRCPDMDSKTLTIKMSPLKFPRFGDDSQAISMVVTLKDGDFKISVPGKLVAFARGKVYGTVALVGTEEPEDAELKKVAKLAVRKLDKVL